VRVDFGEGIGAPVEHFVLGDIRNTDGSPWECCPREFLRRAIAALQEASGLELTCAFEQEFVYTGIEDRPGHPYSLSAFRRQGPFGESLVAALRAAAVMPDSFLTEYGPRQFEFTVAPQPSLKSPANWLAPLHSVSDNARSSRQCRLPTAPATACISISACTTRRASRRPIIRPARSA
jgi:glutamine synthetase